MLPSGPGALLRPAHLPVAAAGSAEGAPSMDATQAPAGVAYASSMSGPTLQASRRRFGGSTPSLSVGIPAPGQFGPATPGSAVSLPTPHIGLPLPDSARRVVSSTTPIVAGVSGAPLGSGSATEPLVSPYGLPPAGSAFPRRHGHSLSTDGGLPPMVPVTPMGTAPLAVPPGLRQLQRPVAPASLVVNDATRQKAS